MIYDKRFCLLYLSCTDHLGVVVSTDLTGSKDGTVRLWEWGHMECINEPRKPGAFPKVTKVLFNAQGNKV